jgi:hypothetical protein
MKVFTLISQQKDLLWLYENECFGIWKILSTLPKIHNLNIYKVTCTLTNEIYKYDNKLTHGHITTLPILAD